MHLVGALDVQRLVGQVKWVNLKVNNMGYTSEAQRKAVWASKNEKKAARKAKRKARKTTRKARKTTRKKKR
jgi:uncharacterized membrane protein